MAGTARSETAEAGPVILFGSGEIAPNAVKVYDWLLSQFDPPIRVSVLETPAGFQPNSAWVAERVADFLRHHLQNYALQIDVVPARKRDTAWSPDDPQIVAPLRTADVTFLGPGSPTYAVRQLRDSLAWHTLIANHRLGGAIVLASAATIAAGAQALPVYEIYKVGEDLHWQPGLDLFASCDLSLTFVPHWNNREGGADLDTSRCFMGRARFARLRSMLPAETTVVGIDEHTALVIDLASESFRVLGLGRVVLLHPGEAAQHYRPGEVYPLQALGSCRLPAVPQDVPAQVWTAVRAAQERRRVAATAGPPPAVRALVAEREAARQARDWAAADRLRDEIADLGWEVRDTSQGPQVVAQLGEG